MSYQPYPTGGGGNMQYPSGGGSNMTARPPQPQSLRIAVILMYVGAAITAVALIIILAFASRVRSEIATSLRNARTRHYTAAQIHSAETGGLIVVVILLLIIVGLWLLMAWANNRGQGWARIVASVLCGVYTLYFVLSLRRLGGPSVLLALIWLIGLAALFFLWRRDTTQYISQSQAPSGR